MTTTNRMVNELKIAGLFDKDSDYNGMVGKAVKELLGIFQKQGHSGMSAPHVARIFERLVRGDTLTPLTGKNDEWIEVENNMFQNKRCPAVFKDSKRSKAYYLDAIVWQGEKSYDTFTGTVQNISSRQNLSFPFMPKTFFVDVKKKELKGDDYKYTIKDRKQLKEVFKYYEKS